MWLSTNGASSFAEKNCCKMYRKINPSVKTPWHSPNISLRASSPIWVSEVSLASPLARAFSRDSLHSRVLARLASLAQIGELARRLPQLSPFFASIFPLFPAKTPNTQAKATPIWELFTPGYGLLSDNIRNCWHSTVLYRRLINFIHSVLHATQYLTWSEVRHF